MFKSLRHLFETLTMFSSLALLGVICLVWTVFALPLWLVLPRRLGVPCGRWGILIGFRVYVWSLRLTGAYRLDLAALRELRGGPAVVLAPNHPSLIDALFVIAHDPNVACVMKSSLMNNLFLGAGARLAGYIRNEPPRRMIAAAVEELRRGGVVLLFPEGTRTVQAPINPLKASVGIIAKHAGVPVQTLVIEQDSAVLSKGWPLFRRPTLPITYRMRLGRRFDPPADVRAFTVELEQYYRAELAQSEQSRWIEDRRTAHSTR
ncbi:MAG TPA: lysophospholipid acyltransferase family protein [Steroidobacteraceae bacterium]|nr:lysophospholipid acyltransferase family protein [Steroidobacteraceae bacterium]